MAAIGREIIDLTGLSESSEEDEAEEEEEEEEAEEEENGLERGETSEDSISEDESVEIPLDGTSRAKLHDAIAAVNEGRLRRILIHLVDVVPAVESALMQELVTLKRKTRDMISRWEICSNCDEEFDAGTGREVDECAFHPGELEANEDEFVDWDENCHGPMDTPENRHSYPENFQWSCCESNLLSEGCVRGMHQPVSRKKQRM